MGFSYSKVSCHHECPFKYKCRYIDKLEPVKDLRPDNALYEGTAVHEGLEHRSVDAAIESYKSNYPEITDAHEVEILKMKTILPRMFEQIPEGEYEYKLTHTDGFIGFIDMLVPIEPGVYDLVDFKYSVNPGKYKSGDQIMLYKYYYENLTGNKIRNMYYAVIPKISESLKEDTDRQLLESKIVDKMSTADVTIVPIEYDPKKINYFFARKAMMMKDTTFEKRYSTSCKWCEFATYCSSGGTDTTGLIVPDKGLQEVDL